MRYTALWWLSPPAIFLSAPTAYAVQYFTVEEAQKFIFPQANAFESWELNFSQESIKRVEQASRSRFETRLPKAWKARSKGELLGYFMVDEVYGKHELITYAVALNLDRSIKQIEIMDYRETRGGEIRDEAWRKQFTGKKFGDAMKLDRDILNITGATISCQHITQGIQRILALFQETPTNE